MSTITHIMQQARRPNRLRVMTKKVWRRVSEAPNRQESAELKNWLATNACEFTDLVHAYGSDDQLWLECQREAAALEQHGHDIVHDLHVDLGGGGYSAALLFLTRLLEPQVVVETGVAAGYSSAAILTGLAANGSGRLWSSDFPYFRLDKPERYIGVVVDDSIKGPWTLLIEGDEQNLPKIAAQIDHIDLLHYDSDKSYAGRANALDTLRNKISTETVVVFDDIQNNNHFMDLVASWDRDWWVFEWMGKYLGVLGRLPSA